MSGFANKYPKSDLSILNMALQKGELDTLVVMGENLLDSKVDAASLSGTEVVFLGTHANETSKLASVVLHAIMPSTLIFAKSRKLILKMTTFFVEIRS